MKFSKFYINIFSLIISSLIIVIIIGLVLGVVSIINIVKRNNSINFDSDDEKEEIKILENIPNNEIKEWNIKIESIGLNQKIKEGVDSKIISTNIGHYSYTDNYKSNICLLGKESLSKLNQVKVNDVIEYRINNYVRNYKVRKNIILDKIEINEYINTFEEKNIIKIFGFIQANENKIRYVEAVEFN